MVFVAAGQHERRWFGVAWEGECFIATAVGRTFDEALGAIKRYIPDGVELCEPNELSMFFNRAIVMLGELEDGNEANKEFELSDDYRSQSMRRILRTASAIPIGYVSTYGNIARAVGSEARAVGRAMATNPLYPIVPCHRVVGAGMDLVGYSGRQDEDALYAKLMRLIAERMGAPSERNLDLFDGLLTIYPVERVINAARENREKREREARIEAERKAAENLQLRLF